jgi:hypothetical protein
MSYIVRPTPGNFGNEQKAEHTPSAHSLTLGAAMAASSAYRRGKKERVNRLRNVTKPKQEKQIKPALRCWRQENVMGVWFVAIKVKRKTGWKGV